MMVELRMTMPIRLLQLAVLALLATGCTTPTSATAPLSISCPSVPVATSLTGAPVPVSYTTPTAKNGATTLTATCSPQSGFAFPVGTTTVTCRAESRDIRATSCTFGVTVQAQLRLAYTRFLSFGDSITEGKVSPPLTASLRYHLSLLDEPAQLAFLENRLVDNPLAYPQLLQTRLRSRYPQQPGITVLNDGVGGEYATIGAMPSGAARLPGSLLLNGPDVLLLMEGTNDMLDARGPDTAIVALEQMIQTAVTQGRRVMLATIPPVRPVTTLRFNQQSRIPGFNDRVRALAASRNVPLVEVYNALAVDVPRYIGEDHLHPTALGYQVIAETFFTSVRAAFEQGGSGGQTQK
jgi:lysophospholipase L1-like esterase